MIKNKKFPIILISAVAAVVLISAAVFAYTSKEKAHPDYTMEITGYYVISVNPTIEIAFGASGNLIEIRAQNEDGQTILEGEDFYGMTTREAVAKVMELIELAGYLNGGENTRVTIGCYTDTQSISEDEIVNMVPEKYRLKCEIVTQFGKTTERNIVTMEQRAEDSPAAAETSTPSITATPEASSSVEISPEPTAESESVASKSGTEKSGDSDNDGVINKYFALNVRISGDNAVFTWNKLKYVNFNYGELQYIPKATSTWKEDVPKLLKKISDASTTSCSISLSSLSMKANEELFFFYFAHDKDPRFYDSGSGTYPVDYVSSFVSIKKRSDGTYKVYNDNPSPYGHGEVGVDYLPPTMTISNYNEYMVLRWENQTHEDYRGAAVHVSKSSAAPSRPDNSLDSMFCYFSKSMTSFLVTNVSDHLRKLKYGQTYYFTIYSTFMNGTVVKGNTIKATVPKPKAENVSAAFNSTNDTITVSWTHGLFHPYIIKHYIYNLY